MDHGEGFQVRGEMLDDQEGQRERGGNTSPRVGGCGGWIPATSDACAEPGSGGTAIYSGTISSWYSHP
eukprot:3889114-Rhodomonas_salina.1